MTRRAAFKQADLTRALRGAQAAGLEPRGCKINPTTGEIEMQFGMDTGSRNSFDQLMGAK
ncbi:hypothetical protein [Blastomonas sp.]|uniref:hypothetical protein n=1 Tax=Blastomonas sp. TaxID=1909299 RepID=UPI00359458EF